MRHANTYLQQAADILGIMDAETKIERRKVLAERWHILGILRRYEAYRRGSGNIEACPHPKEITEAIEYCIRKLKENFR